MTENTASRPWELFAGAMAGFDGARPTWRAKTDELCRAQAELLEQAASLSQTWFARCREGAAATHRAALGLCDAADMMEAGKIYQQWLAGSFERLVADGVETQRHVAGMAQLMLGAMRATAAPATEAPASEAAAGRRAAA
jgi:hypothetical protein